MTKFFLGVDGGNTNARLVLSDIDNNIIDILETGSCSHEALCGFRAAKAKMKLSIETLLSRNNLSAGDISSAVFGLAGCDFEWQKLKLETIIKSFGFKKFLVVNDGYLAVKAGCPDGIGVSNVNGTSIVTAGIDKDGKMLQIDGAGVTSCRGGGEYIAGRVLAAVYDYFFRCGKKTLLTEKVFEFLNIKNDTEFIDSLKYTGDKKSVYALNKIFESAVTEGDYAAAEIAGQIGEMQAYSVAGAIKRLNFDNSVDVTLSGSVWVKGRINQMLTAFEETLKKLVTIRCDINIPEQPPVSGAVSWAIERFKKI